jgi:NDP-sugar pyrophosphorylase family protein
VFTSIPVGQAVNSIGGVYDRLIAERPGSIRGWITDARYWDIGTVTDYWKTSHDFSRDHEPPLGPSTRIAASAIVTRSIIWDDVEVGNRAILDECIVTDCVTVPEGAAYRRMILMRGADRQISAAPFIADE